CRERYLNQPQKRYGLLASSRARNLEAYGIPNGFRATSRLNAGAWYIDPSDSPQSCCALERCVTEFGCQGLELDLPIVGWGDDLRWDGEWRSSVRQRQAKNPLRLRLNSYRVLLTRGRDGLIVFVPPEAKMDCTYKALQSAGLVELG
ncbi:MAG: DNA/RNA helicase domain-containing protein, partial [Elainella sp.]